MQACETTPPYTALLKSPEPQHELLAYLPALGVCALEPSRSPKGLQSLCLSEIGVFRSYYSPAFIPQSTNKAISKHCVLTAQSAGGRDIEEPLDPAYCPSAWWLSGYQVHVGSATATAATRLPQLPVAHSSKRAAARLCSNLPVHQNGGGNRLDCIFRVIPGLFVCVPLGSHWDATQREDMNPFGHL